MWEPKLQVEVFFFFFSLQELGKCGFEFKFSLQKKEPTNVCKLGKDHLLALLFIALMISKVSPLNSTFVPTSRENMIAWLNTCTCPFFNQTFD